MKRKFTLLLSLMLLLALAVPMTAFAEDPTGSNKEIAAPTDLHTVNQDTIQNGVILEWTDNSDNEQFFLIEKRDGYDGTWYELASVAADVTTYHDLSLINRDSDDFSYYRVRGVSYAYATHIAYSPYSSETIMQGFVPAWPTELVATANESDISLTWTDNSDFEEDYTVYRKDVSNTWDDVHGYWRIIATIPADSVSYVDNTALGNIKYDYMVQAAHHTAGYRAGSAYSNEASAKIISAGTPGAGSIGNFERVNTYTHGQFSDVGENDWFADVVATVYEFGLMYGNSVDTFNPFGNMKLSEAVTLAARMNSTYTGMAMHDSPDDTWYGGYVSYAVQNGIIAATDFSDYNRYATRAEIAYIFSSTLPAAEFAPLNVVNSLPDVNSATPYYSAIIMLYEAGVVGGNDALGSFSPDNNIMRVEVAALITRMIQPNLRLSGRTFG